MSAATITSKGQITIPRDIRALLKLQSGDKVSFVVNDQGMVNFIPVTKSVTRLKGIVSKPAKPVSIEAMNATIRAKGSRD
jgi:AbrB family looped-hinge helix DNA binding protein